MFRKCIWTCVNPAFIGYILLVHHTSQPGWIWEELLLSEESFLKGLVDRLDSVLAAALESSGSRPLHHLLAGYIAAS